jgi:DNA-binding protein HU-beta
MGEKDMRKKELIEALAEQTNLTARQAEGAFKAIFQLIQQAMIQEGKVTVPDFGSFSTKVRAQRKGRNPATGKEITLPETTVAVFKPSIQLKNAINNAK